MPRGGKREGAGAPKGNLNALKHGKRSAQLAELGATIAASPTARKVLLEIAARDADNARKADETAAYIVAEVLRRGIVRGKDRLIVLPETLDRRSIKELMHPGEEENGFSPRTIKPPTRNTTPNRISHGDRRPQK
jgi:hypothetical protein